MSVPLRHKSHEEGRVASRDEDDRTMPSSSGCGLCLGIPKEDDDTCIRIHIFTNKCSRKPVSFLE